MALIGREDELERINKEALRMAREVADETGTLMAGNISNTNIYAETVLNYREKIWKIFKVRDASKFLQNYKYKTYILYILRLQKLRETKFCKNMFS